jgi:hypothetical protein
MLDDAGEFVGGIFPGVSIQTNTLWKMTELIELKQSKRG